MLSIGCVGSCLSIGSVASFASILSIDSCLSVASIMSFRSRRGILRSDYCTSGKSRQAKSA